MMVAHSILQGGPGLSCLSPVVYSYILTGHGDSLEEISFLKDIPVTAATTDVINFIQEVCVQSLQYYIIITDYRLTLFRGGYSLLLVT